MQTLFVVPLIHTFYAESAISAQERKISYMQTSLVVPSSSLYPTASIISWIAVKSILEQASPRGESESDSIEDAPPQGMSIKT